MKSQNSKLKSLRIVVRSVHQSSNIVNGLCVSLFTFRFRFRVRTLRSNIYTFTWWATPTPCVRLFASLTNTLFFLLLFLNLLKLNFLIQPLMLLQRIISLQKLLPIKFTKQLPLLYSPFQASMMYKVSTVHPPKESFLFVATTNALKLLNFYIQLLTLDYIPPSVFAEVTWEGGT